METRPARRDRCVAVDGGLGGFELGPEGDESPDVDRATHVIEAAIEAGIDWLGVRVSEAGLTVIDVDVDVDVDNGTVQ